MKFAINTYCLPNKSIDYKEFFTTIKKNGFDGVLIGINESNFQEKLAYCNELNLEIEMVHCKYFDEEMNLLWTDCKTGDLIEKKLITQIESLKSFKVNNFVLHVGNDKVTQESEIILGRIKRLLNQCEMQNINLAIENLNFHNEAEYILEHLQHPNLKMCYDFGHHGLFCPNIDLVEKYKNIISCIHIHDNEQRADDHKIVGQGKLDLNKLKKDILKLDLKYLTAEIKSFNCQTSLNEFIKLNHEALVKLI